MSEQQRPDIAVVGQPEFAGAVGVARADITPPAGIYSRSWGSAVHDIAEGIHRPLMASCIMFRNPDSGRELYLLCLDLGWWRDNTDELEMRASILRAADIEEDQLIIHMGHTHSAPATNLQNVDRPGGQLIPAYRAQMERTAARVIGEARTNAQPAVVSWRYGACRLARNRDLAMPDGRTFLCGLNPGAPADDTLLVGRVCDSSGKTFATLVNYACHPVSLGGANTLISPDYIGALRELVERDTGGAPCLFLHGASGDLTPLRSYEADPALADQNGRELGYAVLSSLTGMFPPQRALAYEGVEESGTPLARWRLRPQPASTVLESTVAEVELPYADLPSEQELLHEIQACTERWQRERLERRLFLRRDLGEGTARRMTVRIWQIGGSFLVATPAEAYSSLQIEMRKRFPEHAIAVINIANGCLGYLPPAETYSKAGLYQVKTALFRPGCLEKVADAAADSISRLAAR